MTPVELSRTVLRAVRRAVDGGELRVTVPGRAVVTRPGPGGCGDYATNIALQLARPAGRPPTEVAEILRSHLLELAGPSGAHDRTGPAGAPDDTDPVDPTGIADVTITGPGFLNISLRSAGHASAALVQEIRRRGPRYGWVDHPTGQLVRLHAPHEVRAVVVMDAAARILRSQGALVRTSCAARPEPEWTDVLGAEVDATDTPDAYDTPGAPHTPSPLDVTLRPAPAPADPTPLGRDAARWALLYPAAHDLPRVGGAQPVPHLVQRESNPLFRVRYAYARTRALTRNAADLGFDTQGHADDVLPHGAQAADEPEGTTTALTDLLPDGAQAPGHPEDTTAALATALTTTLADHPRVLAQAAAHRAPDRLARHLVGVADATLAFVPMVLPRGDEKPSAAHRARLALAEAAGTVLAGGLTLLGIDAPEHL
ncbi:MULTISPECIES: ArgS-related anticodon-binding protein NrtL [unclassified Streptomyces]|uniref:ArgS-related anticodon-binding protein NrtL n=1 Tax=unclassified Streptomyces TaxID=2593676 RepID=UPI0036E12860